MIGSYHQNENLLSRFAEIVLRYGFRNAVIADGHCYTFSQLDEISNQIATEISFGNRDKNQPVAILTGPSVYRLASIIGVLKSGHPFVSLDISFPANQICYILTETSTALLLTDKYCVKQAETISENLCPILNLDELPNHKSSSSFGAGDDDDAAAIVYTSGSTGNPKGVVHTFRSLFAGAMSTLETMDFTHSDIIILVSPPATIGSLSQILSALLSGAVSVPVSPGLQNLYEIGKIIAEQQITIYSSSPSLFRNLWASFPDKGFLHHLRIVRLGGEPVLKSDLELCRSKCGNSIIVQVSYGSTETFLNTCINYNLNENISGLSYNLPIGWRVEGKQLLILDDALKPAAIGQTGELFVAGAAVAKEYLCKPDLNWQKFVELSGFDGVKTRFFRTGDYVVVDDKGLLHYKGRYDNQVKINGNRVEIFEVENAIKKIQGISECVVKVFGNDNNNRLTAFYSTDTVTNLSEADMRKCLLDILPSFKIPGRFYHLDTFPMLANGKIDRNNLFAIESQPSDARNFDKEDAGVLERFIEISSRVLNNSSINPRDNFFFVGGDSLRMLQLIEAVRAHFHYNIDVSSFLENPTFIAVADTIARRTPVSAAGIVKLNQFAQGTPIVFAGAGAYVYHFADKMKDVRPVYAIEPSNHPEVLAWDGDLNNFTIEKISSIFVQMIEQHIEAQEIILIGYSFFGVLAYETAHQLIAKGRKIGGIILLDSVFKISSHPVIQRLENLKHKKNVLSDTQPDHENINVLAKKLNQLKNSGKIAEWNEFEPAAKNIRALVKEKYTPRPIDCSGLLVHKRDAVLVKLLANLNHDYGWGKCFIQPIELVEVPATHTEMTNKKNISAIVGIINTWLSNLNHT